MDKLPLFTLNPHPFIDIFNVHLFIYFIVLCISNATFSWALLSFTFNHVSKVMCINHNHYNSNFAICSSNINKFNSQKKSGRDKLLFNTKIYNWDLFYVPWGTITVGVHKRNVSPQNHSHDTTLNDHYVYRFIYFGEFIFSFNIHILCDWNGCDLDDLNMFLNVLKHISGMLSHYVVLLERNQQE
jgi:hypothetical protein